MRTVLLLSLLALPVTACSDKAQEPIAIGTVSVDELDRMLANHECQPVDVNGDATRRQMGIIPGAVLLGDADLLDRLPTDKYRNLVFYCANVACRASHDAAAKAVTAGYPRVKVLRDGIAGWVKAGKQTDSI